MRIQALPRPLPHLLQVLWLLHLCAMYLYRRNWKYTVEIQWKQWLQVWDAYEEVTDFRIKTSRLRVATFITCISKEARLWVHYVLIKQVEV